jgi:hypothetical protein
MTTELHTNLRVLAVHSIPIGEELLEELELLD